MLLGIRLDPHPYASFRVIIQIDTLITNSYQLAMLLNVAACYRPITPLKRPTTSLIWLFVLDNVSRM